MGSICNPKQAKSVIQDDSPHERQIIEVNDISQLKSIRFQFTTEMLIHVKADLLILFADHTVNFKKNQHFSKLPIQGGKLEDHAKAYLDRHQLGSAHGIDDPFHITFNIIIPTLNFNKVSILFCNIWKQKDHNDTEFKNLLRGYFDSIKEEKFQSIAFCEFTSELGVHLQKGVKRIMRQIVRMTNKPQEIQFVCLSEQSRAIYMEGVNYHTEDVRKSFVSENSLAESSYY